jgi:hypothetical protein
MLAPNDDLATEFLASITDGYHSVNAAAIALRQTHIMPIEPPPTWLPALQQLVENATATAEDWLAESGPDLIASLPGAFVTYESHFDAIASGFNQLDAAGATTQLSALQAAAQRAADTVAAHQDAAKKASDALASTRAALESAIKDASTSLDAERAAAENVMTEIATLEAEVADAASTVKDDPKESAMQGKELTVAVLELAVAAEASLVGGLTLVVAVGALIYSGIQTALENAEISKKLTELRDLYVELTLDAQRIAGLQAIVSALQRVDASLLALHEQLALKPLWTNIASDVQEVIGDIPVAKDFRQLPAILGLADAAATWHDLAVKAKNIQNTAATVQVVNVKITPLTAAA